MTEKATDAASPFARMAARIDAAVFDAPTDRVLMETSAGWLTYASLGAAMRRLNTAFRALGLAPGDRAAVFSQDDAAVVTLFFALLRAGITPVMGDGQASAQEEAELLKISRPAAIFADAALLSQPGRVSGLPAAKTIVIGQASPTLAAASLADLLATSPPSDFAAPQAAPEIAVIVFTSGTTSEPKGVALSYGNLIAQLETFAEVYGFDAETRLLNVLPMHHVDGLFRGPLSALWFGGAVLRPLRFGPGTAAATLAAVAAGRATHFITVPAMLGVLMRMRLAESHGDAFRTADFRFVLCSADYLEPELWSGFEAAFGVIVVNAYGLSEAVCDAIFCGPDPESRRVGTLGRPHGCVARVLDEDGREASQGAVGELALMGPMVMTGYFDAPEATAAVLRGGWFHTGDFVRLAGDGCFEFVGRRKTRIVRAGVTIHPESITSVLLAMPGVAEAATFGVADGGFGDKIIACVAPAPGFNPSEADVAAHCRERLGPERTPSRIHILPELPRGAAGKVALDVLARSLADAAPGAGAEAPDVYRIAAECFNVDAASLSPDSTPFNTDGWDSLAHISLIEGVEAAFGFEMSAIDIAGLGSLGDVEEIVAAAAG